MTLELSVVLVECAFVMMATLDQIVVTVTLATTEIPVMSMQNAEVELRNEYLALNQSRKLTY